MASIEVNYDTNTGVLTAYGIGASITVYTGNTFNTTQAGFPNPIRTSAGNIGAVISYYATDDLKGLIAIMGTGTEVSAFGIGTNGKILFHHFMAGSGTMIFDINQTPSMGVTITHDGTTTPIVS